MFKKFEETFTNDLRYRAETVSLNQESFDELADSNAESCDYSAEDLVNIWGTLERIYGKTDESYILMYLVYYLGYSYRDASTVIGMALSCCHKRVKKAIVEVQRELLNNKAKNDSDPQ